MLDVIDFVTILLAGIGQTTFVITWALLPWWREWIGRALMVKAFFLALFIDTAIVFMFVDWRYEPQLDVVIHILVTLGIYSQVIALAHEKRKAHRGDRLVMGTDAH